MKAWNSPAKLAARTPESRNRYVDFLRAISIFCVITGHWIAAAPHVDAEGTLTPTHVLDVAPWTHWLTWGIQVMPVFFMVGGFSNGISWEASQREGKSYAAWLDARLRRLVGPVLVLVATWVGIGVIGHFAGLREVMIRVGSQMALIPIWFLAVYLLVVVLTPITHVLWQRHGMLSFWGFVAAAVAVDVAFFAGVTWLAWINYVFVWSAVHQLGYAWRAGAITGLGRNALWAVGGFAILMGLVELGPYPTSMVGVPGEAISNTTPPKITLLALTMLQAGLLLALQEPLRRWLARARPWTATVLVNGMIMTIYLWHLTALVLVIGLSYALGGTGLSIEPGTGSWWATRPVWLLVLSIALLPLVLLLARFERPKSRPDAPVAPPWRLVSGALLTGFGLAFLALGGVAGTGWLGLRVWAVALPFVGALLMSRPRVPE